MRIEIRIAAEETPRLSNAGVLRRFKASFASKLQLLLPGASISVFRTAEVPKGEDWIKVDAMYVRIDGNTHRQAHDSVRLAWSCAEYVR